MSAHENLKSELRRLLREVGLMILVDGLGTVVDELQDQVGSLQAAAAVSALADLGAELIRLEDEDDDLPESDNEDDMIDPREL